MEVKDLILLLKSIGIYHQKVLGTNVQISCPFAFRLHDNGNDKHYSMGLSSEKELFNCFACKSSGTLTDFIRKIKKIDWFRAIQVLYDHGGGQVDHKPQPKPEPLGTFPESWLAPFDVINYKNWKNWRGISRESSEYWKLGYDKIEKRIIFPIWNESGELVGCVGRMLGKGQPKWYFYWGMNKSFVVYALNKLQNPEYLVVVEGCLDVILGIQNGVENLVGIQGSLISNEQVRILLSNTDTVVLALDNDSSGSLGTKDAVKKLRDKCKLFKVIYPKEIKDIGEMKRDFQVFERGNWQIV